MKFYLYSSPAYGLLTSFDELDYAVKIYGVNSNQLRIAGDTPFTFHCGNDVEIVYRREDHYHNLNNRKDFDLESDGIHVIKTQILGHYSNRDTDIIQKYYNTNIKVLFLGGNLEQFIFSNNPIDDRMWIDKISSSENMFLIHNIPLLEGKRNTLFTPKMAVMDYVMMGREQFETRFIDIFYAFKDIFPKVKKDYRIGFHIGGLRNKVMDRETLLKELMELGVIGMDKFYYTMSSRRDTDIHQQFCIDYGYDYNEYVKYDNADIEADLSLDWQKRHRYIPINYTSGLSQNNLRSEIELVYETNLQEQELIFKKITEKTLKLIMLGKPFLHIDPLFYLISKKYGFKPYDNLYGMELIQLADKFTIHLHQNTTLSVEEISSEWMPLFAKRVKYLMELSEKDWISLIIECRYISQQNLLIWKDLFYNHSVLSHIRTNPHLYSNLLV